MKVLLFSSLFLCFLLSVNNLNRLTGVDDITVKVADKGANIEITRKATETGYNKRTLTISLISIKELTATGEESGPIDDKHVVKSFSKTELEFTPLKSELIGDIKCKSFSFIKKNLLNNKGTLKGSIYIFEEEGNIIIGSSQQLHVYKGAVLISYAIEDWPFCLPKPTCKEESCCNTGSRYFVGSSLEVVFDLISDYESESENSVSLINKQEVDLGDYVQVILSKEVKLDGTWKYLSEEYPKQENNPNRFTVKIPKFKQSALIENVIDMHGEIYYSRLLRVDENHNNSAVLKICYFMIFIVFLLM